MAEDLVFKASVEGGESITTLRKQYKELQGELATLEKGTDAYNKTLQKLGATKDDLDDLKATINSLNPEGKVAAFQNVAGKLAGGFQAATGAAALFGAESEDLEKTLLKVQAATAFAQGIQSIAGMGDAFRVLGAVISASPIFLVAAAIAAIAAAAKIYNDNFSDSVRITKELTAANEELVASYNEVSTAIDRQVKLSQAAGGDQLDILQLQVEKYDQLNKSLGEQAENYAKLYSLGGEKADEYYDKAIELEKQAVQAAYDGAATLLQIERVKEERAKKAIEDRKKDLQEEQRERQQRIDEFRKFLADNLKAQEDYDALIAEEKRKAHEQELKDFEANLAEQDRIEQLYRDYEDNRIKNQLAENKRMEEAASAESIQLEQQTQEAKKQAIEASLQASQALSDLYFQFQLNKAKGNAKAELEIREKQFKVDKAFNIARAIIDGIRSVQAALTLPPPASYVLAAANGILAAANIAKIASTKFDAGGASPSIPQTNVSVPSIPNPQEAQPSTRLNPDGSPVQNSTGPTRAYVVESDISDKQKQVSRIEKQSQF